MAGKIHCQESSRSALGDLRRNAPGQLDVTGPLVKVPRVEFSDRADLLGQRLDETAREQCDTVALALRIANDQVAGPKVDVLDTEAGTLEDTQTCAVKQLGLDRRDALEFGQHRLHLDAGHDDRHVTRAPSAHDVVEPTEFYFEHSTVEEQQRR